ncbi:MAG: DUF3854 domain-containing protein [Leptolyngbyaceae cyanobacterium MO_188.B28]|nr:DUF3854 domain-containing protein [Leptolyngbyaceae cyanobacterium MO_188.B28]
MIATLSYPSQSQRSEFARLIEQEFITGSAISPGLFAAATAIHADLEFDIAGDPVTPIHDALNWRYTRFGYQVKDTLEAILLQNEDGSVWQAKLSKPRIDREKTKTGFRKTLNLSSRETDSRFNQLTQELPELVSHQKYEFPEGVGSRPYLPPIDKETRAKIAALCGEEPGDAFWDWVASHPDIPLTITEGGKKSLCLLGHGDIAIALIGVNGGYRTKDKLGNPIEPHLIPELQRFCQSGRKITLAFDQDSNQKTRRRVANALSRFGGLLQAQGCEVFVAQWKPEQGKGIDDLIVNHGIEVWELAHQRSLTLDEWRLFRLLDNRLTLAPSISLKTNDLQTLQPELVPDGGVIAIASAKGTGKTKLISELIQQINREDNPVLLAGHRIALMRNLCSRMGVDYRGDLDKVQGDFITAAGYTLRVGFCVDALLSINPEKFRGCDLVIDEVVQVLRHLLTSSTCNKDGKRPALLARLHRLIQIARRVIIADADLNNAAIHYIQELRDDGGGVFLIRNDFQPEGYPVRFIEAIDSSAITAELLLDLEAGEQILIATDSKAGSKSLERLVSQIESLGHGCLVINSETSSGEQQQGFMQNPASFLAKHPEIRAVIVTPSMATGVSIECDYFTKVYGLFWGVSSTDADMAQALGRERRPIPRVVWCARAGRNFSQVSRDTNQLKLRQALKDKTTYTVSLIRSSLREDIVNTLDRYDWRNDPHLRLWAEIETERNRSMHSLRSALKVRLIHEGNQVEVEALESNEAAQELFKAARQQVKEAYAKAVEKAENLDPLRYATLKDKESISPEEQLAIAKYEISEFYHRPVNAVDEQLVLADRQGRTRGEVLNLEAQLKPKTTVRQDAKALEKQAKWNQGYCPWDIRHTELRRRVRSFIGLDEWLDPEKEWTKYDLTELGAKAREAKVQIKVALNFTISDNMSDVQIAHQLLSQMGLKASWRWARNVPGHEGEKLRVYRLDLEVWENLYDLIVIRETNREKGKEQEKDAGSPSLYKEKRIEGDPAPPPIVEENAEPVIKRNKEERRGGLPDLGKKILCQEPPPEKTPPI